MKGCIEMKIEIEINDDVYKLLEEEARERKLDVKAYCNVAVCFSLWDAEVRRRRARKK